MNELLTEKDERTEGRKMKKQETEADTTWPTEDRRKDRLKYE